MKSKTLLICTLTLCHNTMLYDTLFNLMSLILWRLFYTLCVMSNLMNLFVVKKKREYACKSSFLVVPDKIQEAQ
jgi:hypothetical protein